LGNADKVSRLQALEKRMRDCVSCPLHEGRTHVVPGGGNIDAKIMLIGEAPGRNEDETGQPFVGMAGKNLDKLLERAGVHRADVFICNVVKCRPPNNRKPEPVEMDACAHFLQEQIALINPALIICLGGTAARAVLGLKQINEAHGKLIPRDGRYYFVAYHPAARFHRAQIAADFDALRTELHKIPELARS
jgi:uracil-DNA glycosylase